VRLSRIEGPHQLPQKRSLARYRFYRALQWLKSPMRYICEIFGVPRFSSFSTQSARSGLMHRSKQLKLFDHVVGAGEQKIRACLAELARVKRANFLKALCA
jgi:hypothetical protein